MLVSFVGGIKAVVPASDSYYYVTYFPFVITYLPNSGTRPPMNSVMKQVRDLDYDQVETEHRALLQVCFLYELVVVL